MNLVFKLKEIIWRFISKIDLSMLFFLFFILNYRLSFKILALIGIYLIRPNFKFQLNGLFYFYTSMILIALTQFIFFGGDYSGAHFSVLIAGSLIWLACLLTFHQISLMIKENSVEKIISTLEALTIVNFVASCFDLFKIILITGTINPYTQTSPPPYGISSGDLIGGAFGSMHLVNTIICGLLMVLFIYRGSLIYTLLCLIPFLLTGSNLGTFIMVGILLLVAFLNRAIIFKNLAFFSIAFIVLFYIKVTPSNQIYMISVLQKVAHQFQTKKTTKPHLANLSTQKADTINIQKSKKKLLTRDELIINYIEYRKKQLGITSYNNEQSIDTNLMAVMKSFRRHRLEMEWKLNDYVFYRKDSVAKSKSKMAMFEYGKLKKFDLDNESGKITSFKQTKTFLTSSWSSALFGAGIGSFSSRLAFITSGIVDDSRMLMSLPYYETNLFKNNHKAIFKYLMYRDDDTHSITNLPFCWYNQLLGEYGLIGFFVFILCYVFFWLKKYKYLSFGKYIFIAMLGFFFFDYWYERISVVVIFEMLMLLDLKLNHKTEP